MSVTSDTGEIYAPCVWYFSQGNSTGVQSKRDQEDSNKVGI